MKTILFIFVIIIGIFIGIFIIFFLFYKITNKDDNVGFQDFIIEKTSGTKVKITKKDDTDEILQELKLKGKKSEFVKQFVLDFKPEQAAARAGYKSTKCGFTLIKSEEILNAVKAILDTHAANALITPTFLQGQMAIYAQSNIADYFTVDGTFKGFDKISRAHSSCIQSFHKKFDKEGRPEFKITLYDAMKANENLGKVYQIYEKPNEDPKEFDDMSIDEILEYLSAFMPEDAIEKLRGEI